MIVTVAIVVISHYVDESPVCMWIDFRSTAVRCNNRYKLVDGLGSLEVQRICNDRPATRCVVYIVVIIHLRSYKCHVWWDLVMGSDFWPRRFVAITGFVRSGSASQRWQGWAAFLPLWGRPGRRWLKHENRSTAVLTRSMECRRTRWSECGASSSSPRPGRSSSWELDLRRRSSQFLPPSLTRVRLLYDMVKARTQRLNWTELNWILFVNRN